MLGEENQDWFLEEFTRLAADNNIKYFIFAAFDAKWKVKDEGSVGASWGLYYSNRRPKSAIDDYVSANDEYFDDHEGGSGDGSQNDGGGGGCFVTTAGSGKNSNRILTFLNHTLWHLFS